ncbi:MAG: hypothetical protein K9W43_14205 [Candidatus Thorarchaeota archaeon]|nr:hypothetical protein [Candidatus Thorarchaeota archaeon]
MSEKALRKFSSELDNAENTARIRLFGKAAKKYEELAATARTLKPELFPQLQFLSMLYSLIDDIEGKRDPHQTGTLEGLLQLESLTGDTILMMTLPGGRFGEIATSRIFTELKALKYLYQGVASQSAETVRKAVDLFMSIGDEQLIFSRYLQPMLRRVTGRRAALECEARAQIIEGVTLKDRKPSQAVSHFMIAVRALRNARLYDEEQEYQKTLLGLRVVRTCWFCGRKIQGASHLVWMKASVSDYFRDLLEQNNEDVRMVGSNRVVACKVCYSAISEEANRIAATYHEETLKLIRNLMKRIEALERAV